MIGLPLLCVAFPAGRLIRVVEMHSSQVGSRLVLIEGRVLLLLDYLVPEIGPSRGNPLALS